MTSHFRLAGAFGGFVRNAAGKRRLLLHTASGEAHFRLPRALRRELEDRIAIGAAIAVAGFERENGSPAIVRVDIPGSTGACLTCPIRVCTKKNCWKRGGRELWHLLERELPSIPGAPPLEAVDCLDRCKRAPNLDCGALEFERCTPERLRRFLRDLAALHHP